MEYSIETAAAKMIQVILALSVFIAVGGALFFRSVEAVPFAAGVALAAAVNVVKVILLKKSVESSLAKDPVSAKFHLQYTYFLRLILTAAVLVVAALVPQNIVNLFGTIFGIFTLNFASYSMRYFFRHELNDDIMAASTSISASPTQDAINDIEKIVSEYDEAEDGNKK